MIVLIADSDDHSNELPPYLNAHYLRRRTSLPTGVNIFLCNTRALHSNYP